MKIYSVKIEALTIAPAYDQEYPYFSVLVFNELYLTWGGGAHFCVFPTSQNTEWFAWVKTSAPNEM